MTKNAYIPVVIALALLIASAGGYYFWRGMVERAASEAAELGAQLRARSDAGANAAASGRALAALEENEARINGYFLSETEIVTYLEDLEATGERLGATVEVLSVGNTAAKAGQAGKVQVSLSITGSFDAVVRTVGAIEYQAYDTRLVSLALDSPTGETVWTAAAIFEVGTGAPTP